MYVNCKKDCPHVKHSVMFSLEYLQSINRKFEIKSNYNFS